jgi:hypothetical protein
VKGLHTVPFVFPDLAGQKVLVLGLGGGCDILTAFAVAKLLEGGAPREIVYANTKTADVGSVEPVTAHVLQVTGPLVEAGAPGRGRGKCWIDHSVPRSPNGSPWIVLLSGPAAENELAGEIQSLKFDLVIGVDTGGDSIASKGGRGHQGRDQRMLGVLRRTGLPLLHVVVAPGSDGEASLEDLRTVFAIHVADGRYRGCFALDPLLPVFHNYRESLGPSRTPQIILAAFEDRLARAINRLVVVPRGRNPAVPRDWLTTGFVLVPRK